MKNVGCRAATSVTIISVATGTVFCEESTLGSDWLGVAGDMPVM